MIQTVTNPTTHVALMGERYPDEIKKSVTLTQRLDNTSFDKATFNGFVRDIRSAKHKTEIILTDKPSVEAIMAEPKSNRVCVLSFADYLTPGGMFLTGSMAQEESLCAASTLYNILEAMKDWYSENEASVNNGLWTNRALYSPNVIFERKDEVATADVITCAAPNVWQYMRTVAVPSNDEIHKALASRIEFVLKTAAVNRPDVLILGAYGCGAFSNDAEEVAGIFKELLTGKYKNLYKKVVFAIPHREGKHYRLFQSVLGDIVREV